MTADNTNATVDLVALWQQIEQAGGPTAYINSRLQELGLYVTRQVTQTMTEWQRQQYSLKLQRENRERKKLKKLVWRAYKATHVVYLGEGIYWRDQLADDRWDIPNKPERLAENELPALETPEQLAEKLGLTIAQLRHLAYHRDAARHIHYIRFTIPKRSGGERAIWAPTPQLKAVQRWILHNIVERLPVHGAAHGFLHGRSILTNARLHFNPRLVVKIDLKDFFPTVTWRRVKGVFRRGGYNEAISTLLALLCTEAPRKIVTWDGKTYYVSLGPRCLPQGAPTSPAITNVLCLRLDRRLTGLVSRLGWRYTRYADDLTFSLPADHVGPPRLGTLLGCVKRIVQSEGFEIQPEKTRVHRPGGRQTVTGLVVNGDQLPRTPRRLRRKLRAAVHNLRQGKPLPEGESLTRLRGYAAYLCMTHPKLGRKYLEELASVNS